MGLNNYDDHQDQYSLYKAVSDRYTFTTTFGLRLPNASWTLDLGSGLQLEHGRLFAFNKLVRFSKRFHDAVIELTVRDRNDNLSFAFRINILCGKSNPNASRATQEEQELYPWRNPNDLRDM